MADKEVNLKVSVDTKNAVGSLGALEEELEDLNKQIKAVPANSKEFKELSKQIATTGREVKNLELSFESLDNEQVAGELGSVAGAVGDVSAAFILMGDDSETLQEVAKNIEMAMGLSMGLKGAIEGVSSARKLLTNSTIVQSAAEKAKLVIDKLSLNSLRQNIAGLFGKTAATTADTAATAGATTATTFFGAALNLLPIAAIITGITLLIVFFDDVKKAIMSVANSIYESFKPSIDVVVDALQWLGLVESDEEKARAARQSEAVAKQKKIAAEKLALINAEIEANKKLTEEITSALDFEIAKRQAAGEDTAGLERSKLEVLIKSAKKEIELSELKNEARIKEIKIISKMGGVVSQVAKDRLKEIEEEQLGLVKNLESLNQQLEIFDIKQAKIKSDKIKQASAESAKERAKAAEEEKKRLEKEQEEIDKIIIKHAEKRKVSNIELIEEEKSSYLDYMALIQKTALEQQAAEDLLREEKRKKQEEDINNAANLIGSLTALNNAALEAQLAGAEGNEAKQNEIRKKAFARDKALQLAMATVNGVQAVLSTFAGTPGGLVIKSIAAGLAGATALANITKIARTKFEGSGGGSVPSSLGNTASGAGGADVRPVTNTTTTTGESTKVYVTEQDISNTQNKVSVNEAQATI